MMSYGCPYCKEQTELVAKEVVGVDSTLNSTIKLSIVLPRSIALTAEEKKGLISFDQRVCAIFRGISYCPICGAKLEEVQRYAELKEKEHEKDSCVG